MMKRHKNSAALSLAKYSLGFVLAILVYGAWLLTPISSDPTLRDFTVSYGQSVKSISSSLYDAKLLRSPLMFRFLVRSNNLTLQAGNYSIPGNLPPLELARTLTKAYAEDVIITIPEGVRVEQIGEILSAKLSLDVAEFIKQAKPSEGYLFPDTYHFAKDATVEQVITTLKSTFEMKTKGLNLKKSDVILASIIERETLSADEKPIVAGILLKRLNENWALEVDASIQYIMGKPGDWWPTPLIGDRSRKSPYNTYLNQGLPPAPIGNPGLASLAAAVNPKSSSYYFYLHDKSGKIHYGATLAEHNLNIAKYIETVE